MKRELTPEVTSTLPTECPQTSNPERYGLSEEEIQALVVRVKDNSDDQAGKLLLKQFERLFKKLAGTATRQYSSLGTVEFDDLIGIAQMELIIAIHNFDPDMETKFCTYLTTAVYREMQKAFKEQGSTIAVPRNKMDTLYKSYKEQQETNTSTSSCTEAEQETLEGIRRILWVGSLNDTLLENGDPLIDVIPSPEKPIADQAIESIKNSELESLFSDFESLGLTGQEIQVLSYRFGLFNAEVLSYEKIADHLNLKTEKSWQRPYQVRQLEKSALRKLRANKELMEKLRTVTAY